MTSPTSVLVALEVYVIVNSELKQFVFGDLGLLFFFFFFILGYHSVYGIYFVKPALK